MSSVPAKLGRYEIVKHLANGGMAQVLIARATGIEGFERHVVVKRIHADRAEDPAFVQMFLDEARLAAALHHNNIVQVHDIGKENGEYFFAMEYVHGQDLRILLRENARKKQKVPWEHVVTIMTAAASGLHHAHELRGPDRKPLGLVHRDVSPANILVGYDGTVKVVDFGIAKAALRTGEGTRGGALKGKVSYMAPEQCAGKPIDRRSDVYALGVVLYEVATVRRLFKGDNDFLTMSAIVSGNIPHPADARPDIPPQMSEIILKALARNPKDRYQTADEMREALEQFASEQRLRTSTGALASYMKQLFGSQPEPWLVDEKAELELTPDFDGSASGVAQASDDAVNHLAIPDNLDPAVSAPILRARRRITEAPPNAEGSTRLAQAVAAKGTGGGTPAKAAIPAPRPAVGTPAKPAAVVIPPKTVTPPKGVPIARTVTPPKGVPVATKPITPPKGVPTPTDPAAAARRKSATLSPPSRPTPQGAIKTPEAKAPPTPAVEAKRVTPPSGVPTDAAAVAHKTPLQEPKKTPLPMPAVAKKTPPPMPVVTPDEGPTSVATPWHEIEQAKAVALAAATKSAVNPFDEEQGSIPKPPLGNDAAKLPANRVDTSAETNAVTAITAEQEAALKPRLDSDVSKLPAVTEDDFSDEKSSSLPGTSKPDGDLSSLAPPAETKRAATAKPEARTDAKPARADSVAAVAPVATAAKSMTLTFAIVGVIGVLAIVAVVFLLKGGGGKDEPKPTPPVENKGSALPPPEPPKPAAVDAAVAETVDAADPAAGSDVAPGSGSAEDGSAAASGSDAGSGSAKKKRPRKKWNPDELFIP